MSLSALNECGVELRRLAIAGSRFAPGDYRLKRLLEPLRESGKRAPIFTKVADSLDSLLATSEEESGDRLLALAMLVRAILSTQGRTGAEGELEPLKGATLPATSTPISAKILKQVQQALTLPGSGRQAIIEDGYQRGVFRDFRLIGPAVAALEDRYPEIADFIAEKVLPQYGEVVAPLLLREYDPAGKKKADARRLSVVAEIRGEKSRDLLLESLEKGTKEIKIAALRGLGKLPGTESALREHLKSRSKDIQAAAQAALTQENQENCTPSA